MHVYTRYALFANTQEEDHPALLLEGGWPNPTQSWDCLDAIIDGSQGWIDEQACRLAAAVGQASLLADLNALKLRYYLVKLLRVVVYFDRFDTGEEPITLHAQRNKDEDYAQLLEIISQHHHRMLEVQWHDAVADCEPAQSANSPRISVLGLCREGLRRSMRLLHRLTRPRVRGRGRPRLVLCGNSAVLDPICQALLARRARVCWLYDRLAMRTWARWRLRGVDQWTCHAAEQPAIPHVPIPDLPELEHAGVNLAPVVRLWLEQLGRERGSNQLNLLRLIRQQLYQQRPACVVLDEDATPMARATALAARELRIPSVVVQHGVPRVRFGFAPLAVDSIFVWGNASANQLSTWGVAPDRIRVTGSPRHDELIRQVKKLRKRPDSPRRDVLFLATTLPDDERPDAVSFGLNRRNHAEILHMACRAVAALDDVRLVVKLHPRSRDTNWFQTQLAAHAGLDWKIVTSGDASGLFQRAACAINCTSSAGVDAALAGLPVIEMIPPEGVDLLPAAEWGAIGTARDEQHLQELLKSALSGSNAQIESPSPEVMKNVFANLGYSAAARVADELLSLIHSGEAHSNPAVLDGAPRSENRFLVSAAQPTSSTSLGALPGGWRGLLRDGAWVSLATVVGHALGVATALLLRLLLSPAQMGVWQGLKLVLSYGNYAGLGVSKAAAREVSLARGSGDAQSAHTATAVAMTWNTASSGLYALAVVASALWVWQSGSSETSWLWATGLLWMAGLTMLQRFVTFQITLFRARGEFSRTSLLSMQEAVVSLAAGAFFTWLWGVNGLCLATAVVLLGSLLFLRRKWSSAISWRWDQAEVRRLITIGAPLLGGGIASSLFRSLDKLMILAYLSDREFQLGCYSLALMVSTQLYGVANILAGILQPRLGETFGRSGSPREAAHLAARATQLLAPLVALTALAALLVAPPLLSWLLPDYRPGLAPLVCLVPGAMALGMALPITAFLAAINRGRTILIALLAATGFATLANHIALSHGGGLTGVATATTIADITYFLALAAGTLFPALNRWERVRYGLTVVGALAVVICVAVLVCAWMVT